MGTSDKVTKFVFIACIASAAGFIGYKIYQKNQKKKCSNSKVLDDFGNELENNLTEKLDQFSSVPIDIDIIFRIIILFSLILPKNLEFKEMNHLNKIKFWKP